MASQEKVASVIVKLLCVGLSHKLGDYFGEQAKKNNSFIAQVAAPGYAALKVSRDMLIESILRDAFPKASDDGLKLVRRATGLLRDGKLILLRDGKLIESLDDEQKKKEKIRTVLEKEFPGLGKSDEVIEFFFRLEELRSKR